jgi:hypothetical protein
MKHRRKKNRDLSRQNKANSVVVGTIYSQIALDGIQSMMKICKSVITAAGKDTQQMQIIDGCKLSTQLLEIT